jgi:hypothetical protein
MQHPTVSPDFVKVAEFEDKIGDAPPAPTASDDAPTGPKNVWDLYTAEHVDPHIVSVEMQPDKTTIAIGERISFRVTTGQAGYLIVLERGTSGKVNLIFPDPATLDAAKVDANTGTDFPSSDQAFTPDAAGSERIKAILFDSQEGAAELIGKLAGTAGLARDDMRSRDLVRVSLTPDAFYTSEITFEVTQ